MINKMGVVEVYDDFFENDQAKNIIEAAEAIDKSEIQFGFEDATIGKGHKGGEVRSNLLMSFSKIAFADPMQREYREAVKLGQENLIIDIKLFYLKRSIIEQTAVFYF